MIKSNIVQTANIAFTVWKGMSSQSIIGIKNDAFGTCVKISGLNRDFKPFINKVSASFDRQDCKILNTKESGGFQFAAPPEILKTLNKNKIDVPQKLILASNFVKNGEIMNEIEFALYFNVFVKNRKLQLIGTEKQLAAARVILQESLLGPKKEDVNNFANLEQCGYFQKELEHFRKGTSFALDKMAPDRDKSKLPELEDFVDFIKCDVGESLKFSKGAVADIRSREFDVIITHNMLGKWIVGEPNEGSSSMIDTSLFIPLEKPSTDFADKYLTPPDFGVTFAGTSHGFDADKRNTSFVLWANGTGILIDPLFDPKGVLHKYGIDESKVPNVFLTHVHADHDAGLLKMVLGFKRIKLITSKIIYESFLRKAQAMADASDMNVNISRMIDFTEVTPNTTLDGGKIGIPGLSLEISSGLHSIPTIRFRAVYKSDNISKSLFYSGDTFYDQTELENLHKKDLLSDERYYRLLGFGWNSDYIIHESGVPPIHTSISSLGIMSWIIDKPIYIVHTSAKPVGNLLAPQEGQTLEIIPCQYKGLESIYRTVARNTLVGKLFDHLLKLNLIDKKRTKITQFNKGETIIEEGTTGNSFYFVLRGKAGVISGETHVATLDEGEYFGDVSLFTSQPRNATIKAETSTSVWEIPKDVFEEAIRVIPLIKVLMETRWKVLPSLSKTKIFKTLPMNILNELTMKFEKKLCKDGDVIIKQGELVDDLFIISKGKVTVHIEDEGGEKKVAELVAGDIIGEIAFFQGGRRTATVRANGEVELLALDYDTFYEVKNKAPGLDVEISKLASDRKKDLDDQNGKNGG